MSNEQSLNRKDTDLDLLIKTPSGDWRETFAKTVKVSEVIDAVIKHFNYAQNGRYELRLESDTNTILDPHRPLVSYGIKDDVIMIFVDYGMAV